MSLLNDIYALLPTFAQNAAATVFGYYRHWLRFGRGYDKYLAGYSEREKWPAKQLEDYQKLQLKTLLTAAADHIPYYSQTWTTEQKQAAYQGDLTSLPLLDKSPIRTCPENFARTDYRARHKSVFHTSGSSGTPVASYWSLDEVRDSRALREARSANWAGVSFNEPRATFSGRIVVPDPNSKGPFHRFNSAENQVYFSAFHLSPQNAQQYVDALRHHHIQWLTGYAVSYYLLARFILDQNIKVPPLKAIITTSEKVTPKMRSVMEKAYGCKVYEEYSSVENAVFVSECEHGSLHLSSDAGVMEILRPDGTACDPGEVGEVVTTSFVRQYQPFIRYRLGDMAAWATKPCQCGRALPVVQEIVGRMEDVVVGPDGRQMVRFHGIFADQPNIVEAQVIQETINTLRIKIVPTDSFNTNDESDVISRIHQRLGNIQVTVETVKEIPRTKAGKFKAVISLLAQK